MINEQILEMTIKNLTIEIANLQQSNALMKAKLQAIQEEKIAEQEKKEDEE